VTKVVGESFQGVSSLALPMAEHDHVAYREEATPSEANQRLEENNTKCASSCNLENEHVKITIPSQDEQHNDEDELSAKDLLCLAWQIAQGMVSRNWNSPEYLKRNFLSEGHVLVDTGEPSFGHTLGRATKRHLICYDLFNY
jgi:hypothetical protein